MHATWYDYKDERVQLIASRKKNAETAILMLHQVKYYFTFRVLVHSVFHFFILTHEDRFSRMSSTSGAI